MAPCTATSSATALIKPLILKHGAHPSSHPCLSLSIPFPQEEEDHNFTTAVSGIWKDIKFLSKPLVQEGIIMCKMPVQVDECFFFCRLHVAAMLLD